MDWIIGDCLGKGNGGLWLGWYEAPGAHPAGAARREMMTPERRTGRKGALVFARRSEPLRPSTVLASTEDLRRAALAGWATHPAGGL